MVDNGNDPIVVGFDGSAAGVAALRWGASEAVRRGCDLRAVAVTEGLDTELSEQVKAIASGYPEMRVRFTRVAGSPGPALVLAAREAALLVVGSRGHGRWVGALLGSVSGYCTAHAGCPVVVVPDPERVTGVPAGSDVDVLATPGPLL